MTNGPLAPFRLRSPSKYSASKRGNDTNRDQEEKKEETDDFVRRGRSPGPGKAGTRRYTADDKSVASAETTTTAGSASSNRTNRGPTIHIPVSPVTPLDPEFLSKSGFRCLVIDLPGVLIKDITVTYRDGFVRAVGERTIGHAKAFRKRVPINKEQIVPTYFCAYLNCGVLVVVVPTKVATTAFNAALTVAEIALKIIQKLKPTPPTAKLLKNSPRSIKCEAVSTFWRYLRIGREESTPDTDLRAAELTFGGGCALVEETAIEDDIPEDEVTENLAEKSVSTNVELQATSPSKCFNNHRGVTWTDDSLKDEAAAVENLVHENKGLRSRTVSNINTPVRDAETSPIGDYVDSPDIWASAEKAERPLTFLQHDFERVWNEQEGGEVRSGTIEVTPNLPFQYELADMNSLFENGLETELEPHPYWKSAPFLPRLPSSPGEIYHDGHNQDVGGSDFDPSGLAQRRQMEPERGYYSSLLRQQQSDDPRRKRVTWVDEI